MTTRSLDDVVRLAAAAEHLAVVSTLRGDQTIQASLVNAGLIDDPVSGRPAIGFVTYGAVKLRNLRARPQLTVTFRAAWDWATVEGRATLIGPDDPADGIVAERLRLLLREVFAAAGGTHDDWDEYDRAMLAERRTAVLVDPIRTYGN
jgi:PPOX class probable F420-dependent enzyme